jgi:hypothetical protein
MKTKQLFITIFMFVLWANLFAQEYDTYWKREWADSAVFDYMKRKEIALDNNWTLHRNDRRPEADGSTLLEWCKNSGDTCYESLSINYPCWAYKLEEVANEPHTVIFFIIWKYHADWRPVCEIRQNHAFGRVNNWTLMTEITGIKDSETSNECIITPNPVTDFLNIECTKNISRIEIFDSSGKTLITQSVSNGERYSTDVSSLKSGVYILTLFDASDTKIKEHKFIKN